MYVEPESGAIVFDRAEPHGSLFGERITSGLLLEAQGVQSLPYLGKLPWRVEDHQVHDALARTPRTAVLPTCSTVTSGRRDSIR